MFNRKTTHTRRHRYGMYGALGGLMMIGAMVATPVAPPVFAPVLAQSSTQVSEQLHAQLFNSALDQLPATERNTLRNGNVIVARDNRQFVGRVLVNASVSNAWQVLTDYDNFDQFLPNVESSQLLEAAGDRRVFNQISAVRVFPVTKRVEVTIAATEQHPQQIAFTMLDGDARSIQGIWRIAPIAPYRGATPKQVLITHQVNIEPEGGAIARDIFFNTYTGVLENTLAAIKSETEQR